MAWWLATPADGTARGTIPRFDPRYWTVNFSRPMMASVTTPLGSADRMRVDTVFYAKGDLCGLIWSSEDTIDHPLLRYQTVRDYRGSTLSFRWQSGGIIALDQLHGPTLTIEGRDSFGAPRAWYVRLWNYASGSPTDATISIDFDNLDGGYFFPADRDRVFAGHIDRMFISLVPVGYEPGSTAPLPSGQEGFAEITDIVIGGANQTLAIGDSPVEPHTIKVATGYDDQYNITPARVLRNIERLGHRGSILHYVGMSHYFRLNSQDGGYFISLTGGALNTPCIAWHTDFCARCHALGYDLIMSLSYEILDQHLFGDWKQIDNTGSRALTGWVPPSSILSPCNADAMGYLQAVARAFTTIAALAGLPVNFQVGEPWWWVQFLGDYRICLYDAATLATYAAEHGGASPPDIGSVREPMSPAQNAYLDWAGTKLAASTLALTAAVRAEHPDVESYILIYLPTILDDASPEVRRANVPLGWAKPAFDVLQLEDYDWVTEDTGRTGAGVAAATARLGYPLTGQNYLSGFVLNANDEGQWALVDEAAENARVRGTGAIYFWALPQVMRDGFVHSDRGTIAGEATTGGELWTVAPNWKTPFTVTYEFKTDIFTSRSGKEQRRAGRSTARRNLKFLVTRTGSDAWAVRRMLNNFQGAPVQMADHSRFSRVTAAALASQSSAVVDDLAQRSWLAPGRTVVLFNAGTYALAEVVGVNAGSRAVTFAGPFGRDWPIGTKVLPLLTGKLEDSIAIRNHTARAIEADIAFNADPGLDEPDDAGVPLVIFNDREVFTYDPNFAQPLSGDFARKVDTVDFGRGRTATYLPVAFGSRTRRLQMLLRTQAERRALVGLFLRQKGMRGEFYMPTFEADFTPVATAPLGGTSASFADTALHDTFQADAVHRAIVIAKADGSAVAYRRVSGTGTSGGNTTLTVDAPWPFAIDSTVRINWLVVHRFAADQLSVECVTDEVSQVQVPVVSLEDLAVTGADLA